MNQPKTNSRQKAYYFLFSIILLSVVLETFVSSQRENSYFSNPIQKALNLYAFFTIWSNLVVAFTAYYIAQGRKLKNTAVQTLYIAGLGSIGIIAIIHRLFLYAPSTGIAPFSDALLHLIIPLTAIAFHLVYIHEPTINKKTILLSTLLPNIWLSFTYMRGFLTGYYPYSFLDPAVKSTQDILLSIFVMYSGMYVIIGILWLFRRKGTGEQK